MVYSSLYLLSTVCTFVYNILFKEESVVVHQAVLVEYYCLKKNQSTPRPSEHPPVMGEEMSKRLGGIEGCKYKTSSWHLNRFPDADNIGSTV